MREGSLEPQVAAAPRLDSSPVLEVILSSMSEDVSEVAGSIPADEEATHETSAHPIFFPVQFGGEDASKAASFSTGLTEKIV